MRALRFVTVLALALGLSGCFQIHTLLTVFPDGSGRLTQTFQMRPDMAERLRALSALDPSSKEEFSLIDKEELHAAAKTYGPGVVFEGVKALDDDGGLGYVATYRVADVTALTLTLTPAPSSAMSAGGTNALEPTNDEAEAPLTFAFDPAADDALARLTVTVPTLLADPEGPSDADASPDPVDPEEVDPEEVERLRELFRGLRFSMAVRVAGEVVETNASHPDADQVTLFAMDFDALLDDPEAVAALQSADRPSEAAAAWKERLLKTPGTQIETQPTVTISFRGD